MAFQMKRRPGLMTQNRIRPCSTFRAIVKVLVPFSASQESSPPSTRADRELSPSAASCLFHEGLSLSHSCSQEQKRTLNAPFDIEGEMSSSDVKDALRNLISASPGGLHPDSENPPLRCLAQAEILQAPGSPVPSGDSSPPS